MLVDIAFMPLCKQPKLVTPKSLPIKILLKKVMNIAKYLSGNTTP